MDVDVNSFGKDVGVALIFFNRPEPLKKVFNAIRLSRPDKLFLIQDGARKGNEKDVMNIQMCREIVEKVDWDCKVYKNFSDVNLSCDHRVFTGISWAFEYVEKLVIFEDDCLPSPSFIPFCQEVLAHYQNDLRVLMISGMNYFDEFKTNGDSYFFSNSAAGWGWATWKRSWETAQEQCDFKFLENKYLKNVVEDNIKYVGSRLPFMQNFLNIVGGIRISNLNTKRINSWEYALGISKILNSSLIITPTKNLVSNIGLTDDSTHAVNHLKKLSKQKQKLFFKKTFELEFPLKHPKYVIRNFEYEKMHRKLVGSNNMVLFFRNLDSIFRRLYYSNNDDRRRMFFKFINKLK